MNKSLYFIFATILCFNFTLLPAQTHIQKTIPNENDHLTEFFILDENSDSTECFLYLFEDTRSYMLIVNYKITPELIYSYFLSQGEYTMDNNQVVLRDDIHDLVMKADRNDMDDLIFEQGLDFMTGKTFFFAEKTSQLPGPPFTYNIFPANVIQKAIDQARTTETKESIRANRYQTKVFSDQILADLKFCEGQSFTYSFMHYPLIKGVWKQEGQLVTLTSDSGRLFYGFIDSPSQNFSVIQLPGFIFEANENNTLYKIKSLPML